MQIPRQPVAHVNIIMAPKQLITEDSGYVFSERPKSYTTKSMNQEESLSNIYTRAHDMSNLSKYQLRSTTIMDKNLGYGARILEVQLPLYS